MTCKACNHSFDVGSLEDAFHITVKIPESKKPVTLSECLATYGQADEMKEWQCEVCGKVGDVSKGPRIQKLGSYTFVTIDRLVAVSEENFLKNQTDIEMEG